MQAWLGLALILGSAAASAGDARVAQDSRIAFKSFATPLIGTWDCSARIWNDRFHERMEETTQRRRFEWVLQGSFLQESIYAVLRNSEPMQIGVNMISVDPETTHVLLTGFSVDVPDKHVILDAELAPDLRHLSGRVQLFPKNEEAESERIEWRWIDERRTSSRIFARANNGREFLHQELVCRKTGSDGDTTGSD